VGETWPDAWLMGALYQVYAYYAIAFLFVHYMVLLRAIIIITIITFMLGRSTVLGQVWEYQPRGALAQFIYLFKLAREGPDG